MPDKKPFPLRLDQDVYDALQRWAASEFRSVNGQIEYLLRCALRDAGRMPGEQGENAEGTGGKRRRTK